MEPNNQVQGSYQFVPEQDNRNKDNTWNKMQTNPGQTIFSDLYQIDCGMVLAFKYQPQADVLTIVGTLLHSNGALLTFPDSILKIITRQLNKINNQSPYWYANPKGQLVCLYKLFQTERNYVKKFILDKVKQTNIQLINLFYILGLKNSTLSHGRKQNVALWKMDATIYCLMAKKQITTVLREFEQRKKTLKQKAKGTENDKLEVQQEGGIDINQIYPDEPKQQSPCTQFTFIKPKQTPQQINKSLKFDLETNKYDVCIKTSDRQESHKQIYLLKKTVKKSLELKLKQKAFSKLRREIQIIKNIKYGKNYFPQYFVHDNIQKFQGILKQQHYCKQNQMDQTALYVQRMPCNLAFCIANDIFVFRQIFNRFKEIVLAVEALHMSGIVHRDLKPQNIMISQDYDQKSKIKIIDFSDSALMKQDYNSQLSNNLGCSLPYSPFQCAFNCQHGVKSPAVDIWSLGVLLHQLFYKEPPNLYTNNTTNPQFIEGMSNNQLCIVLTKRWNKKGFFGYLQEFIQHIIRSCLILIHYQRMGIDLIKKIVFILDKLLEDMEAIIEGSIQTFVQQFPEQQFMLSEEKVGLKAINDKGEKKTYEN